MQTIDTQKSVPFGETVYTGETLISSYLKKPRAAGDIHFDLWAWASGLRSFLEIYDRAIGEWDRPTAVSRDRKPEFHLTNASLRRLSALLAEAKRAENAGDQSSILLNSGEIAGLSGFVQDYSVMNAALLRGKTLGFVEWKTWRTILAERLESIDLLSRLDMISESLGMQFLPAPLRRIQENPAIAFADRANLSTVTSRLGRILRSLAIINGMLLRDEPLKPSLVIFCGVYTQVRSMTDLINNLLSRLPDEGHEVYALLDGASYLSSLELKKAYNQELTGIVGLRPAPSVFARVESAYSLLNDGFQQILTGFARLSEPKVNPADLFPDFQLKLTESLVLRQRLHEALESVRAAEADPASERLADLREMLKVFLAEPLSFLYYKDRESVERFCEEVNAAKDNKALVPILHRFGAYLETLFRQVNMRAVLANHPFEA